MIEGFSKVLDLAGVKIPYAVINGVGSVQRALSENGITNALLGSRSGASKRKKKAMEDQGVLLPPFIAPEQLEPYISEELV